MDEGRPVRPRHRRYILSNQEKSPWCVWLLTILATLLAIGLIAVCVMAVTIWLVYQPQNTYVEVTDAQLGQLAYAPGDGVIRHLNLSIGVLARNSNSRGGDANISDFDISLGFQGTDLARLRASSFTVAPNSSVPLQYQVVSDGARLDAARKRAMDLALAKGELPLDFSAGKARTSWKMGIFPKLYFWTRINCQLTFSFAHGLLPIDKRTCRSRSP